MSLWLKLEPGSIKKPNPLRAKMQVFDPATLRPPYWEGRVPFSKFGKSVRVHVEPDGDRVQDYQVRYINDFLNWDPVIFDKLEDPMVDYFRRSDLEHLSTRPQVERKSQVWLYVEPLALVVPAYSNGSNNYLRFELDCDWEPEHGMEWAIRNGRDVLYVGPFVGASFEQLERQFPP